MREVVRARRGPSAIVAASLWLLGLAAVPGADPTALAADAQDPPPAPGALSSLPRVVVLATGGTIASRYDAERGGLAPALTGEELVRAVPGLDQVAVVSVEQIANIGSSNMTPEIWRKLAARANERLADPAVTAVVVTHGTDTLEETAYFLDLTIASAKPVVLVGAQRAPAYFDTDGPRNLLDAVRVAASPEAVGKGALVVMNGQINAAREVTKTSTLNVETFRTLDLGALGVADQDTVRFYRAPLRRQTIPLSDGETLGRVEIVPAYAGADGQLIRLLLKEGGIDGLVIQGVGLGHFSSKMGEAIREARERGVPVVLSTRVYTGRIVPLYEGDLRMKEVGCVLADNLSPQKARILLMLALTKTRSPQELQAYFDR